MKHNRFRHSHDAPTPAAFTSRRPMRTLHAIALTASAAPLISAAPPTPTYPIFTPVNAVLFLSLLAALSILLRLWQALRSIDRQHNRDTRILVDRSNELESTLSSMIEGVLVVDLRQQILTANDAAAMLLHIHGPSVVGRHIDEVIESLPLRRFITKAVDTSHPLQENIQLTGGLGSPGKPAEPRQYLAQAAVLRNRDGRRIGSLIVFHDVTRLRHLEVVRSDFVTNASHEIKTPVAAIKAAAETLEVAFEDDPESAPKFIGVIARQADRLQALVEDLLTLARLEHDTDPQHHLPRQPVRLAKLLAAAIEHARPFADANSVDVQLNCPDSLIAHLNSSMLEQALVNLLDNAIKYGGNHKTVTVTASEQENQLLITVADQGPGIEPDQLSRIFERFYRTDKARSRQLGGTGLGLAIVRHVAMAHGGKVAAESKPGKGAVFAIHIPLTNPPHTD